LSGGVILVIHLVADAVLVELGACAAEGGGLQHVCACFEVRGMYLVDDARVDHAQVVVAPLQPWTAKLLRSEVIALYGSAHSTIEDEYTLLQALQVCLSRHGPYSLSLATNLWRSRLT
jgi:hypothetical protein